MFLHPEEVDQRLGWPLGRAARLARQGKLPHVLLPDDSVRFEWAEIEALIRHVRPIGEHAPALACVPPCQPHKPQPARLFRRRQGSSPGGPGRQWRQRGENGPPIGYSS